MGFPVGYNDLLLPNLIGHTLTLLGFIRWLIQTLLSLTGLGFLLEPEPVHRTEPELTHPHGPVSVSAELIREFLPVVRYSDVAAAEDDCACDSCAVCLYEFEGDDEIRRLANCRHLFHRTCVDRWIDHDQKTCPLCRTLFVPEDMQESFNERLWVASGISDFVGEVSAISVAL